MTAALPNWAGIGPGSSDAELVLASASGDRGAFAEIYDRYADRLHDFCIGMLRDRDSAADCVQDAFCIVATSLGGLREPDKLRPWLYSIVRNEAHKRLRELKRERPSDEMPDVVSHDASPNTMAHRLELANLISEAAGGLSDRDQAVLELAYRQGLDGPELAMALGVTQTNANTMVGRLRETIERSLGALLVARRIQDEPARCPELAAVLHGWDGKFNILMRKRIARHIESCAACEDLRSRSVNPAALLGAPLFIPAPAWLKNSVTRDFELTSASHGMGNNGAATQMSPRVDQSGFHTASTAARPAIQPPPPSAPPPPPPPPYAPHAPAALVGDPGDGESKRRVVPLMALMIFIPLLALGAALAWVYLPSTALSPSGIVQPAPLPTPSPSVPLPTPAAVVPSPQPPRATPAPVPVQTPRQAAPLPTPQAKLPTPQAPLPTPQAPSRGSASRWCARACAPPAAANRLASPAVPARDAGAAGTRQRSGSTSRAVTRAAAKHRQGRAASQDPPSGQVPDPVGPAPKQVPDPVGPAPKQVPDPAAPKPCDPNVDICVH